MLILSISGVSAEDMAASDIDETSVCEIETSVSSTDIVSDNYMTDSEVSEDSQVNVNTESVEDEKTTSSDDEILLDEEVESSNHEKNYKLNSYVEIECNEVVSYDVGEYNKINVDANDFICNDFNIINLKNPVEINEYDNCFIVIYSADCNSNLTLDFIVQDISSDCDLDSVVEHEALKYFKLSGKVTVIADGLLNLERADDVLVITTAGVPNGKTSEPAIEGILNSTECISCGVKATADSECLCFLIKMGNTIKAKIFVIGLAEEVYLGTISENILNSECETFYNPIGAENVLFACLANGLDDGISFDVLQKAAFHILIYSENLCDYTITNVLNKYNPTMDITSAKGKSPDLLGISEDISSSSQDSNKYEAFESGSNDQNQNPFILKGNSDEDIIEYLKNLELIGKDKLLELLMGNNTNKTNNDTGNNTKNNTNSSNHSKKHHTHVKKFKQEYGASKRINYNYISEFKNGIEKIGKDTNETVDGNATIFESAFKNPQIIAPQSSNTILFAIVAVFMLGIFSGVGYMRRKN